MANGNSAKVHQTKQRITDCLFEILAHDPIERITVAEVCAAARINRSTFYNHFSDLYDVRAQCEKKILSEAEQCIPQFMGTLLLGNNHVSATYFEERMEPYFNFLCVLLNGGDPAFVVRMRELAQSTLLQTLHIERFSPRQKLIFTGVANMQLGLIGYWLQERDIPFSELLDLMSELVRKGPRKTLMKASMKI